MRPPKLILPVTLFFLCLLSAQTLVAQNGKGQYHLYAGARFSTVHQWLPTLGVEYGLSQRFSMDIAFSYWNRGGNLVTSLIDPEYPSALRDLAISLGPRYYFFRPQDRPLTGFFVGPEYTFTAHWWDDRLDNYRFDTGHGHDFGLAWGYQHKVGDHLSLLLKGSANYGIRKHSRYENQEWVTRDRSSIGLQAIFGIGYFFK